MYSDDTKVLSNVDRSNPQPDFDRLQEDIDRIIDLTRNWRMELHIHKCKVMYLGQIHVACIRCYRICYTGSELGALLAK